MNGFEQNLLFGVTVVILAGTLIVFVVQYLRSQRRGRGDDDQRGDDDRGDDDRGGDGRGE